MTISRFIHVAANGIILLFLWLSNIPLDICITSSLSILLLMDVEAKYFITESLAEVWGFGWCHGLWFCSI